MRRVVCLLLLTAGCSVRPPMPAPAPVALTSGLAPASVLAVAVRELAPRGFRVTVSDAATGVLVAERRVESRDDAHALLACPWSESAVGWNVTRGTVTLTVSATPAQGGSAVTVSGTARDASPCTANEGVARAIAGALTSGPRQ